MKTAAKFSNGPASTRKRARTSPRVVYTQAPLQLGTMLERRGDGWLVQVGGTERLLRADATVDVALLEEAVRTGARVVLDAATDEIVIVGLLVTARALTIGPDGSVDAKVRSLRIAADDEVTLKTPRLYIRMQGEQLETYGQQIVTRARGVLRLLGVAIKLN